MIDKLSNNQPSFNRKHQITTNATSYQASPIEAIALKNLCNDTNDTAQLVGRVTGNGQNISPRGGNVIISY